MSEILYVIMTIDDSAAYCLLRTSFNNLCLNVKSSNKPLLQNILVGLC